MKNKWTKYVGITLGMCLALSFSPSFVNADETGEDNYVNLDSNLLNEKVDKSTIVDIQADNVPVLGDLKAQIPAKSPVSANASEEGEDSQRKSALATVELSNPNGLIDDLNVSVLDQSSMQDANFAERESSLASVELSTPITNEVEVDVLLSEHQSSDESSSYDGGLVELNADELPVLGEAHAGILDGHYENDSESTSLSSGLIQADLDDGLLEDTSVDVLAVDKTMSEESSQQSTSLASVNVGDDSVGGLVDELEVSVLEQSNMQDDNYAERESSLASVELSTPITNEVEVDVLLSEHQSSDESSSYDGGLIELNAGELPILGEAHAGVLDDHYTNDGESQSFSSGLIQADLDEGLLEDTSIDVLALDRYIDGKGTYSKYSGIALVVGNGTNGNVDVGILTTENFQPVATVIQPILPDEDAETATPGDESTDLTPGENGNAKPTENTNDLKPSTDADELSPTEGADNQMPDNEFDGVSPNESTTVPNSDSNASVTGDDTVEVTRGEDSTSKVKDEGVVWAASGSNAMNDDGAKNAIGMNGNPVMGYDTGSMLPKTGGIFDSVVLTLVALLLFTAGLGIRRFAH
ncbi:MAG: hypothetical protein ABS920_12455 [Sporosarcina sp.]